MMSKPERRSHTRYSAEIGCKVRCSRTGRYLGASTSDVSAGGAMLQVQTAEPVRAGEKVDLALRTDGRAVILRSELVPARVVRCSRMMNRQQVVAVQFDREIPELQIGARPVAA